MACYAKPPGRRRVIVVASVVITTSHLHHEGHKGAQRNSVGLKTKTRPNTGRELISRGSTRFTLTREYL